MHPCSYFHFKENSWFPPCFSWFSSLKMMRKILLLWQHVLPGLAPACLWAVALSRPPSLAPASHMDHALFGHRVLYLLFPLSRIFFSSSLSQGSLKSTWLNHTPLWQEHLIKKIYFFPFLLDQNSLYFILCWFKMLEVLIASFTTLGSLLLFHSYSAGDPPRVQPSALHRNASCLSWFIYKTRITIHTSQGLSLNEIYQLLRMCLSLRNMHHMVATVL